MPNLANPTVEVNDVAWSIKPNSFSYKKGRGDFNVRSVSAGGGSISTVSTKNAETAMSMVKFSMLVTPTNLDRLNSVLNGTENTVDVSDTGINLAFANMVVTEEPEISTGAEGEFEITFMGPPIP